MTDPWTTPAAPGARTRHFCPLCDWHLDTPDPDPAPAVSREWVEQVRAEHGEAADDPVFLGMLAHLQPIDEQIRAHLAGHRLEEWLAATAILATLRGLNTLAGLGGYQAPDPERVSDGLALGFLTDADAAWISFAGQALDALKLAVKTPQERVRELHALIGEQAH